MSKPKKTKLEIDYSAKFTAGPAATTTAFVATSVAAFGTAFDMPWEFTAAVGVAGSLATWGVHKARAQMNRPNKVAKTLAGVWAVWAAEVTAVLALDPYTWVMAHFWIAAALFITTWALSWWVLDRADIIDEAHWSANNDLAGGTPDERDMIIAELLKDRERADLATRYAAAIHDVMGFTPEVTGLTHWDKVNDVIPGFTMRIRLPKGASARDFSDDLMAQIAQDVEVIDPATGARERGLPNGCGITIGRGSRQGEILIHVTTVNPEELVIEHPGDWSPLTINEPIPLSFTPHGVPVTAAMRKAGAIIVGPPNTGKSTFLNNVISSFARCDDVLVWGTDTSKGRDGVFGPWIHDLPDGAKPIVTRVATTNEESLKLVEAGLREGAARLKKYAKWMRDNNTDLVPISNECPMLFLIFDESAEIFSAEGRDPVRDKLREQVLELMRTTRQAGIRCVFTFVDINLASVGTTDLYKLSPVKIALVGDGIGPNTDAVARWWGRPKGVDLDQLIASGLGVGQFGGGPQVHRGPRMLPSMVEACTVATTDRRPARDLVCVDGGSTDALKVPMGGWSADDVDDIQDIEDVEQVDQVEESTPAPAGDVPEWMTVAASEMESRRQPSSPDEDEFADLT